MHGDECACFDCRADQGPIVEPQVAEDDRPSGPRGIVVSMPKPPTVPVSSTGWSAQQCVEDLLAGIKSGEAKPLNLMIFYFEDSGEGRMRPCYQFQNMNSIEELAILALMQSKAIERWGEDS